MTPNEKTFNVAALDLVDEARAFEVLVIDNSHCYTDRDVQLKLYRSLQELENLVAQARSFLTNIPGL